MGGEGTAGTGPGREVSLSPGREVTRPVPGASPAGIRFQGSPDARRVRRASLWSSCVVLPLLALTWMSAVLAVTDRRSALFQILFAVFDSLEGFVIVMVHCILRREVGRRAGGCPPSLGLAAGPGARTALQAEDERSAWHWTLGSHLPGAGRFWKEAGSGGGAASWALTLLRDWTWAQHAAGAQSTQQLLVEAAPVPCAGSSRDGACTLAGGGPEAGMAPGAAGTPTVAFSGLLRKV